MEHFLDKILEPSVIWVVIPVLAIIFWGLTSIIEALRGNPAGPAEWQADLQQLRARVEALERAQAEATTTHAGDRTVTSGRSD